MTLGEQIKAVEREIGYRKRVYPKWVEAGRLNQIEANYQIEVMEAVLNSLVQLNNFKNSLIK